MKIFKRKNDESKSLYTPAEEKLIEHLVTLPESQKVDRLLYKLQKRYVDRENRIIEDKSTKEDVKNGFTRKEFPWLAKFNY